MIKVKILIVDDELDFCMLMENYFTEKGYDAFIASTLLDGMRLLEKIKPAIVFLDNNLPDGEGWTKVKEIITAYPELNVNLISAYGVKPELGMDSGNIRFWEKPISADQLDAIF